MSKKTKKSRKKNRKNQTMKKYRLNRLEYLKKIFGSIRFHKPETKKLNRKNKKSN